MTRIGRGPAVAVCLLSVVLAAVVGCSTVRSPASSPMADAAVVAAAPAALSPAALSPAALSPAALSPAALSPAALPPVTGTGVRALWQGAPWGDLTLDGSTLLGVGGADNQPPAVHAVSIATGRARWTATMPKSVPGILGLFPAGNVVVAEVSDGKPIPAVARYIVLAAATGKTLWTLPVSPQPDPVPLAVSGKYLLTGDASDAVTGRVAATGAVVWRDPRPAGCGVPSTGLGLGPGLGLAADGPLVGASFFCGRSVVVRRLVAATGKTRWTWRSTAVAAHDGQTLQLTAAAADGGVFLVTGIVEPAAAAQRFTRALPDQRSWPAALAKDAGDGIVLALAASDGHPRWTELGGQWADSNLPGDAGLFTALAPTVGTVCELATIGLECRSDATGAATLPALATLPAAVANVYRWLPLGDGSAGVSDGFAAVMTGTAKPGVLLRVVRVRGGATVAEARIAIGNGPASANGWTFAVDAAALGPHTIVVLVHRVDLPGVDPVLALAVHVPAAY